MKAILFGTTNNAKIKQIEGALAPAHIIVKGITDKGLLPTVDENGKTAAENAHKKAIAYAKTLGEPVFSMDNALYINGLPPENQPGLNVRRINGYPNISSDEQMLKYYSDLILGLGGEVGGYWEFGLCIATPEGKTWETTIKSPRTFTAQPSPQIVEGYPLDSIQIDPESGKYLSEMTQPERDLFWQKTIGQPLLKFFRSVDI
ncbi:MAG: non-canonical purine NTP pyrophosphatase [Candidatus Shapirobacteria bacterium]|jgi:8-oxo-dGTP diphosphatase